VRKTKLEKKTKKSRGITQSNTQIQTTKSTPGLIAYYDTRPGNEVDLFYSSWAHTRLI